MTRAPHVVIIAGPNGAGKSTTAPQLLKNTLNINTFVNADEIAKGLSAFEPEKTALQAGRIMLSRIHQLSQAKESFAFETTLATKSYSSFIKKLHELGYQSTLVFLYLNDSELAQRRVNARVRAGGHHIPKDVVKRRFRNGLKNLFKLYIPIVNNWYLWNNSFTEQRQLIAYKEKNAKLNIVQSSLWHSLLESYGR